MRHFLEARKPIAANCHGPLLLLAAGGVAGRTMTCYPDLELDMRAAGVNFVNRDVVVDGSLVTVRGWPDNGPWMKEFVQLMKGATVGWQAEELPGHGVRGGKARIESESPSGEGNGFPARVLSWKHRWCQASGRTLLASGSRARA